MLSPTALAQSVLISPLRKAKRAQEDPTQTYWDTLIIKEGYKLPLIWNMKQTLPGTKD